MGGGYETFATGTVLTTLHHGFSQLEYSENSNGVIGASPRHPPGRTRKEHGTGSNQSLASIKRKKNVCSEGDRNVPLCAEGEDELN